MKKLLVFTVIVLSFCSNTIAQVNLDSMLVAYYPFNGNANDETGNGNDGTVYGAALTPDRFGNENSAYYFDGLDDYIDCGNSSSLSITTNISVCAWVKSNSFTDIVVSKWKTESGWEGSWYLYLYCLGITHNGWDAYTISANDSINPNEFNLIVGIYNYDIDSMIFYVNGILSSQIVGIGGTLYVSNAKLLLGAARWYANGYHETYFDGIIDEVRIYSRALTSEEVDSLFNDGYVSSSDEIFCDEFSKYQLVKNYPNPFSNKTTIKFTNSNHSNYKVSVFTISGNKVFEMDNIKSDKIEFKKGNLPKGVYLIELKGEDVFRGKMIVK